MEAEGLVVKEPRRSYTVAPLIGLEDLRALIDFRLLIEPAAAAAAARQRHSRAGRGAAWRSRGSGGAGRHDATANRLDMVYDATFHDMVAQLGGNPWLRDSLVRLRSHLHMYRLYHHARQAAATKPEHVAIAEAVVAGEPDAAAEAMRAHLQHGHAADRRRLRVRRGLRLASPGRVSGPSRRRAVRLRRPPVRPRRRRADAGSRRRLLPSDSGRIR